MKYFFILFMFGTTQLEAQINLPTMEKSFIKTKIGEMAVFTKKGNTNNTPIIFLHGVYFDHHLWDNQIAQITDRTVIAIDMPLHGESKLNVPKKWKMDDCGNMLLEILDSLKINKIIAIGHSWGSMTILKAASKNPEKFASVGFCNMPIDESSFGKKLLFRLQHTAIIFRRFYTKQAAKSLFGKESLKQHPELLDILSSSMNKLSNKQIIRTDKFVILNAKNTASLIEKLGIPATALKGEEDYVSIAPKIETKSVKGGHISPLESIKEVTAFCQKVISNEQLPSH